MAPPPDVASATHPMEILELIETWIGGSCELYAVDHAVDRLVQLGGSGSDDVELRGPLRTSLLRCEPHADAGTTWIPVPDRDHTVFVARLDGPPDREVLAELASGALGAVLDGHRIRFDVFEQRRRRQDMTAAAELQWELLPIRADYFPTGRVAGILEPAYEAAGDAFDYAWHEGALWAYSFDGMGHGIDATLTSVVVVAAIRNARRQGCDLAEQMSRAGAAVHEQWGGDRFVTGSACRVADGATEFVNAGHEPSRWVSAGGVQRLDLTAELPLGVDGSYVYDSQPGPSLGDGDGIVLFSDGPGNATGPDDTDALGADRLDQFLERSWSDRPYEAVHGTMGSVLDHIGDSEVEDDLTAVVVRLDSTVAR